MPEDRTRRGDFPKFASRGRRLLHLLVALAGWGLFGWWWWIVLGRVERSHVVFTALFVGATTLIVVTVTGLWSLHNKRLYRRNPPRSKIRPVKEDYSRDTLGRLVTLPREPFRLKGAAVVEIRVGNDVKTYRALGTDPKVEKKKKEEAVHGLV